jgi:hypothetical protein
MKTEFSLNDKEFRDFFGGMGAYISRFFRVRPTGWVPSPISRRPAAVVAVTPLSECVLMNISG